MTKLYCVLRSVTQSCPTLCSPMDCSPLGSPVHGISQARVLEWGAIALSSVLKSRDITLPTKVCLVKAMVFPVVVYGCESWTIKKLKVKVKLLSRVRHFETPWTVAHQAPQSMGFSR